MSFLVETSLPVFLILTVIIGGGAAFLAGRNLASRWRSPWLPAAYMILLGIALRFFHYALFNGNLLSVHYFITDTLVLVVATLIGYRLTMARQMVRQYPWAYERAGLLSWRVKSAT